MHNVLIVGVGSIGERHTRCFLATRRAGVGIVEPNASLRQTIAERYAIKHAFADIDSAVASGAFNAALVATPANLHIPIATKLVEAGLHVLIEKPLATNLEGIDELREAIARKKAIVGVAYVYRAFKPLASMRDAINSGRFGKPVEVVVVAGQHFPTFRPAYKDIYYKDRKTGGGAIQDALTHLVNATEWLVGPIDRLVCDADHQVLEGVSVEDTVHVITRHGRVMGSFQLNQHQPHNEVFITVNCERGAVRFETHNNRWLWCANPADTWHAEEFGKPERDTVFIAQANAFLDTLEGKTPIACSLDDAEQTLRVNLAALASADRGDLRPIR